jgi:RecB family exonuclease
VHGIDQIPSFPFTLNSAVDTILKREFDDCRRRGVAHPLMMEAGLNLIPFSHPQLDTWRHNFSGVQVPYGGNFTFTGAVDDLWVDPNGVLTVVDYKATGKEIPVTALDLPHHAAYKRQIEFYQWLLRRTGFTVSPRAWFVYCTGDPTSESFNNILKFRTHLIPYDGNDAWVEPRLNELIKCLNAGVLPDSGKDCSHCKYLQAVGLVNS